METIIIKITEIITTRYFFGKHKCPKCGVLEDIDSRLCDDEVIKCRKCRHSYKVTWG